MTDDEKLRIIDAYLKGETIEMMDFDGKWKEVCFKRNNPITNDQAVFRVKPDFIDSLYFRYVDHLKMLGLTPLPVKDFKHIFGVIEPYIKKGTSND